MKLRVIKSNGVTRGETVLSIAHRGQIFIGSNTIRMYNLHDVESVNIIQDEDSKKDFFIQFKRDRTGEVRVRSYTGRIAGSSSSAYMLIKKSFHLCDDRTLTFRVGKPMEVSGIEVHPLLINLSELL